MQTTTYKFIDDRPVELTEKCIKYIESFHFGSNDWLRERQEITLAKRILEVIEPKDFVFIDAGANIGTYSLLSIYFPSVNFIAFEPNPEMYSILEDILKINDATNVVADKRALSNKTGESILKIPLDVDKGMSTLGDTPMRFKEYSTCTVETTTIDEIQTVKPIKYIKLDTQGFEKYILEGAHNTILKSYPIIQLEFNETTSKQCGINNHTAFIVDFLNKYNYEIVSGINEVIVIAPKGLINVQHETRNRDIKNTSFDECIIDVGAYKTGNDGKRQKHLCNGLPVVFIEPDPKAFHELQISDNDIKLPVAISDHDGLVLFNFINDETNSILNVNESELHKYRGDEGKPVDMTAWKAHGEYVPCMTLKTVINELKIKKIVCLTIDAQGYDLEVIKSLGDKISIVDSLICEVQITDFEVYVNSSKKTDILKYMEEHGFKLVRTEKQTFDQEENLYFKHIPLPITEHKYINDRMIKLTENCKKYIGSFYFGSEDWLRERQEITIVKNLLDILKPKDFVFLDVGANMGSYSLLSIFYPTLKFIAFEPNPEIYDILCDVLKINNVTNVITDRRALSNKIGNAILKIPDINDKGLSTLGDTPLRFREYSTQAVRTTTIDEVYKEVQIPIKFIKIDTEGFEKYILEGAHNTIIECHPIIQFEWLDINAKQCGINSGLFINDFLKRYNYEIIHISKEAEILIAPKGSIIVETNDI